MQLKCKTIFPHYYLQEHWTSVPIYCTLLSIWWQSYSSFKYIATPIRNLEPIWRWRRILLSFTGFQQIGTKLVVVGVGILLKRHIFVIQLHKNESYDFFLKVLKNSVIPVSSKVDPKFDHLFHQFIFCRSFR